MLTMEIFTVTLTVKDAADNSAAHAITVTVVSTANEMLPIWAIGVVPVVIGIAVGLALVLRRRKQRLNESSGLPA